MAGSSDNVFVGDLPGTVTKEDCETIFAAYGTVVQCRTLPPREAGGKSSALVRFGSVDEASWVVDNLNGNLAEGLEEPIVVRFANSPGAAKGKGKDGGKDGGKDDGYGAQKGGKDWSAARYQPYAAAPPAAAHAAAGAASDNLFIGNLPETITTQDCENIFAQYGTVMQCRALPPKAPGHKASALVRLKSVDEARWVVDNLNGNLAEGLDEPLVVRYANGGGGKGAPAGPAAAAPQKSWGAPQESWGAPQGGYQPKGAAKGGKIGSMYQTYQSAKGSGVLGGKGPVPQENTVYVSNLPSDCGDLDLFRLFSAFGAIPNGGVKSMMNPDGSCKGFGFVDFSDAQCASLAVQSLNGLTNPDGSQFTCSVKAPSKKGGGKGKA